MTRDVFGTYIHTYKFHEGVADGVILDLKLTGRARSVLRPGCDTRCRASRGRA